MAESLKEQFDACKIATLHAILDALRERSEYIASIERSANGDMPVTGIALELFPWHGSFGLSLRMMSDFPMGDSRYDSADWPHFDFTQGCESPSINEATSLVSALYAKGKEPGNDLRDMAHLAFLAGAEALLNDQVAGVLREMGIDAPILNDHFVTSPFQYIVTDVDQTVKSNYCDLVLSNRVFRRLLNGNVQMP